MSNFCPILTVKLPSGTKIETNQCNAMQDPGDYIDVTSFGDVGKSFLPVLEQPWHITAAFCAGLDEVERTFLNAGIVELEIFVGDVFMSCAATIYSIEPLHEPGCTPQYLVAMDSRGRVNIENENPFLAGCRRAMRQAQSEEVA